MPMDARPFRTKETSSPSCYGTSTYAALHGRAIERQAAADVITLNLGCQPLVQIHEIFIEFCLTTVVQVSPQELLSRTIRSLSLLANGTPNSNNLTTTSLNSLKNIWLSRAYRSACFLNSLSLTRTTSVGSIIRDLVLTS